MVTPPRRPIRSLASWRLTAPRTTASSTYPPRLRPASEQPDASTVRSASAASALGAATVGYAAAAGRTAASSRRRRSTICQSMLRKNASTYLAFSVAL